MVPADNTRRPLSLILQTSDWNSSETGCCGNNKSLFNAEQRIEKSVKHNSEKSQESNTYSKIVYQTHYNEQIFFYLLSLLRFLLHQTHAVVDYDTVIITSGCG